MRIRSVALLTLILTGSAIGNAFADMDYHCLTTCMNDGGNSGTCNHKCTYTDTSKMASKNKYKSKKDPHKQFNDLYTDDKLVIPKDKHAAPDPQKDYQCVTQCMQDHMAYQYCQEECITKGTAAK